MKEAKKYCSHGCEVTLDSHEHSDKGNCWGAYNYNCSCTCHEYNSKMQRTLFAAETGDQSFTLSSRRKKVAA